MFSTYNYIHIVDILAFAPPKLRETPLTWVEPACPLNQGKSVHAITTQFPSILCSSYSVFNCQDSWLTCMSSLAPKVCRKGTISQRFWPIGCLSSRHLCAMTAATCFSCAGSTSRPLPLQDVWASSISWLTGSTQQDTLASSAVSTFFLTCQRTSQSCPPFQRTLRRAWTASSPLSGMSCTTWTNGSASSSFRLDVLGRMNFLGSRSLSKLPFWDVRRCVMCTTWHVCKRLRTALAQDASEDRRTRIGAM